LVFAALLFAALLPPAARAEVLKYIEIVREKSPCPDGGCFTEYIFLSDGLAVKKQFDTADYETRPDILMRRAAPENVAALFGDATSFFGSEKDKGKSAKDKNNLFLFDGTGVSSYASGELPAPAFLSLFDNFAAAFAAAVPAEDFYIHQYYQPLSGDMGDYHLFPGGTVMFSQYKPVSYDIVSTELFTAEKTPFAAARALAEVAAGVPGAAYRRCPPQSGLEYGFIELRTEGRYLRSYTCGDGDAPADRLFRHIRSLGK
jgi:hypothetical protein